MKCSTKQIVTRIKLPVWLFWLQKWDQSHLSLAVSLDHVSVGPTALAGVRATPHKHNQADQAKQDKPLLSAIKPKSDVMINE